MNPTIDEEYLDFINEIKAQLTSIPEGYNEPDFLFVRLYVIVDNSETKHYYPSVLLVLQDVFSDEYKEVIILPNFTFQLFTGT
jgi:hypothetical protein